MKIWSVKNLTITAVSAIVETANLFLMGELLLRVRFGADPKPDPDNAGVGNQALRLLPHIPLRIQRRFFYVIYHV